MHVILWCAEKGYELALAPILVAGAAVHGDTIEVRSTADYHGPAGDCGIIIGITKREILQDHVETGHPLAYIDKGFWRTRADFNGANLPGWWRICVNATHPTDYMMNLGASRDRFRAARVKLQPRRNDGSYVLIAGSSEKFHLAHDLPHPTEWARDMLGQIRRHTGELVIYRPKQSWRAAEPIKGAIFDHGQKTPFGSVLTGARVVITYGSIASVDAVVAGVPCITIGNAPARPICSTDIAEIMEPAWPKEGDRRQWAWNLSHCHYTPDEIRNGEAWGGFRDQLRLVQREASHERCSAPAV